MYLYAKTKSEKTWYDSVRGMVSGVSWNIEPNLTNKPDFVLGFKIERDDIERLLEIKTSDPSGLEDIDIRTFLGNKLSKFEKVDSDNYQITFDTGSWFKFKFDNAFKA